MLAIGCDHGGYELKQEIIRHLEKKADPIQGFWMRQREGSGLSDLCQEGDGRYCGGTL